METCDVLVVGGGPAGSTCAGRLRQGGLDVLLLDKERFPRQKPCAGWITPAVLETLAIDSEEYRQGRILQDISSFCTGFIDGASAVTRYGTTVSYGIRRYEFDYYLLQRCQVRTSLGEPVTKLERKDGGWLVNGHIRTRLLVGAGGHFCPVARLLGAQVRREEAVAAQVAESVMTPQEERACRIQPDTPALYFCRDMKGYGWVFRKGSYLNFGLGRMGSVDIAHNVRVFCNFLKQHGDLPASVSDRLQGHAYRLYGGDERRRCVGDGAVLIGDAAGVAHAQSGEGILPAIESALLAAETIMAANGNYMHANLESYKTRLASRFDVAGEKLPLLFSASGMVRSMGARLLSSRWFTRNIVLDRWFLHVSQKPLNVA